jgi:hypothetical protein
MKEEFLHFRFEYTSAIVPSRRQKTTAVAFGVAAMGLGVTMLGFVVGILGGGRPLLGWLASPVLLAPVVGVPLGFFFWPFMGRLLWLAMNGDRSARWLFPALLLGHYTFAAWLIKRDLGFPPLQQDLKKLWEAVPNGTVVFFTGYALAQVILWVAYWRIER